MGLLSAPSGLKRLYFSLLNDDGISFQNFNSISETYWLIYWPLFFILMYIFFLQEKFYDRVNQNIALVNSLLDPDNHDEDLLNVKVGDNFYSIDI